jgi:hypothetical protein
MGAGISVSNAEAVQRTALSQSQVLDNSCYTSLTQNISDINIVLPEGWKGDVNFAQKGTANGQCIFDNNLDNIADLYIKQSLENNAEGLRGPAILGLGLSIAVSSSTTTEEVALQLEQIIKNSCSTTVDQNISNVTITALGSGEGSFNFVQEGDASTTCILTNAAKLQTQLEQQQDVSNNAGGRFDIMSIIILIVVVIIIIVVIVALISIFARVAKGKSKPCIPVPLPCSTQQGVQLQACLTAFPAKKGQTYCPPVPGIPVAPVAAPVAPSVSVTAPATPAAIPAPVPVPLAYATPGQAIPVPKKGLFGKNK